ncbi:MAG: ribosome maturation factor RimP [Alphaproteobacteria bacterium]
MEREAAEAKVMALAEPALAGLGYDLVRVQLAGSQGGLTLQIMAERQDRRAMQVEDCTAITRALDPLLDAADPISGAYALEVSSPGIDRPLTRAKDYNDWAGFVTKLELSRPLNGRKNYRGILGGLKDGMVHMIVDGKDIDLPYAAITKARLLLTDELIKATAAREKAATAN